MDIPKCSNCGATLVLSDKKTKTGGDMYKCPKWLPNNAGCKGEIWFPPSEKKKGTKTVYKETAFQDRLIKALTLILAELKEIKEAVTKDTILYPDDN